MIAFDSVTVQAGSRTLLDSVSFTVNRGDKVVIAGPTGSGKSTILMVLMGGVSATRGVVTFEGNHIAPATIQHVRESVAFVSQEPVLGSGSVREGLLLPFTFRANKHIHPDEQAISSALSRVNLPASILNSNVSLISGGEKQRVAIARAMLLKKKIFVVDEVTSALDEMTSGVVLDLFLSSEYTVLAVSHSPAWHSRFGTLVLLEDGRITEIRTGNGGRA